MIPALKSFMAAHQLIDIPVVADAGMVSEANRDAIEDAGLTFIIGAKIPEIPYQVKKWYNEHPDEPIPDGHVSTQPWPATEKAEDQRAARQGRLLPVQG
jgi:hypothetical protein